MRLNLTLSQKSLILVGLPLIFEILFVGVLSWLLVQAEQERVRETGARELIAHAHITEEYMASICLSLTEHIGSNQQSNCLSQVLAQYLPRLSQEFNYLNRLVAGNPHQESLVSQLQAKEIEGIAKFKQIDDQFAQGNWAGGLVHLSRARTVFTDSQSLVEQLSREVDETAATAKATLFAARKQIQIMLGAGVIINIAMAIGLAIYFNRGTTQRLSVLMDNTKRLAQHQPLNPAIAGNDQIANLDKVFHKVASDLERAEQAKQEYVAMISHDLRSPLTSIKFVLAMVDSGNYGQLTEDGNFTVKAAESNAERLISMINTLLDLEKMEAGRLEMQLAEVCLNDLIERAVEATFSLANQAGVTVEAPSSETIIRGDSPRLIQVLVNLLSNAIRRSPRGSVIKLQFSEISDHLKVRISDMGQAIPESRIQSIFDRFQQVEQSGSTEHSGSGLELALCKAIVEGHGGEIGVTSEQGKGSTFWFRIPACPSPVSSEASDALREMV